jgi:hypothetical protein
LAAWEAVTLPLLQAAPGGSLTPLDARFFYTPADAFDTVAGYGGAAAMWMRLYFTWDVVNPVLYSLIFSLGIAWLFERGFGRDSWLQRLNLVPLAAGLLDQMENSAIVGMMAALPARPAALAWLATVCAMGKVTLLGVSALLLIAGTVAAAAGALRSATVPR